MAGEGAAAKSRRDRPDEPARLGGVALAGGLLGFGLGGFFDGILLHQILQWHHLLSGIEGGAFDDLRFQILADGLFHLLMYVVALAGLWCLWRRRAVARSSRFTPRLLGSLLLGFAFWHGLDAVFSHWLLGLHRVRMDSADPLLWDLGWLALFGLLPALAGWVVLRRPPGPGGGHRASAAAAMAGLLVCGAGFASLRPPPDSSATLVLLRESASPAAFMAAALEAEASLLWSDPSGTLYALEMPPGASALGFYGEGALLVSRGFLPAGCLAWFAA